MVEEARSRSTVNFMQVYFFVTRYLLKIRHAQGNCFRPSYVEFISLTVSELLAMNHYA